MSVAQKKTRASKKNFQSSLQRRRRAINRQNNDACRSKRATRRTSRRFPAEIASHRLVAARTSISLCERIPKMLPTARRRSTTLATASRWHELVANGMLHVGSPKNANKNTGRQRTDAKTTRISSAEQSAKSKTITRDNTTAAQTARDTRRHRAHTSTNITRHRIEHRTNDNSNQSKSSLTENSLSQREATAPIIKVE